MKWWHLGFLGLKTKGTRKTKAKRKLEDLSWADVSKSSLKITGEVTWRKYVQLAARIHGRTVWWPLREVRIPVTQK